MDVNIITDEPQFAIHHPSRETIPLPPGKKFHIFFSYRDVPRDKLWVKRVVGRLEREYGYTCCDHERDFLPGTKILDNIKDGVKNSEKVVVVFSKEAIDSNYVSLEAEMAYRFSLEKRKNILIPVLLDDCDVPGEYMLLTYIDAREGIEETTWWPKLIKSIQSSGEASELPFHVKGENVAADKTFAITPHCSIKTNFNYLRCCIQRNSKYIPEKLRSEAFGVPGDLIRAAYKDLLRSPRVECRQKCYCFARISVAFRYIFTCLLLASFILMIYCVAFPTEKIRTVCVMDEVAFGSLLLIFGVCYFGCKIYYVTNPNSVHKNIIKYNMILSKYGAMVTVVPGRMWKTASLIFYKCRFQLCKEYVLRQLVREDSSCATEHRYSPNSDPMIAPTDDSPLLSRVMDPHGSREQVDSSKQHAHAASQTHLNPCYMDMDDESHDFETRLNAEEDTVQSIPIVNAINPVMAEEDEDVSDVADDKPLLSNQQTENKDYEKKALELLMSCTPEYLDLANAGKLENPKEDRHGIEFLCLCQYLEKVDNDFRKKVKRTKSLRLETGIEEDYEDEAIAHFKNISLD